MLTWGCPPPRPPPHNLPRGPFARIPVRAPMRLPHHAHVLSTNHPFPASTPLPGEGRIRVSLADGRSSEYDLLVGADGIWSRIRKTLVGETKVCWGAVWHTCAIGCVCAHAFAPNLFPPHLLPPYPTTPAHRPQHTHRPTTVATPATQASATLPPPTSTLWDTGEFLTCSYMSVLA